MELTTIQAEHLKALEDRLSELIDSVPQERSLRLELADEALRAIVDCWFAAHKAAPEDYSRELERLNALCGWSGETAQVASWAGPEGKSYELIPKFFGGRPSATAEHYALCISLNHAIPSGEWFADEVADFTHERMADSCFNYFCTPLTYKKFFGPRARVLGAFASALGYKIDPED